MDKSEFIAVSSIENAWARLSGIPEYQRCVTAFFKAPTFYIGSTGLFAGTNKTTGKRAVYCDNKSFERISAELAYRVAGLCERTPVLDLPRETLDDVQELNIQNEKDVKALFKDFKRIARYQRQCRQMAAARELLANARRWTAPFQFGPSLESGCPLGTVSTATPGLSAEVTATSIMPVTAIASGECPRRTTVTLGTHSTVNDARVGICSDGGQGEGWSKREPQSQPIPRGRSLSSQAKDGDASGCSRNVGEGGISGAASQCRDMAYSAVAAPMTSGSVASVRMSQDCGSIGLTPVPAPERSTSAMASTSAFSREITKEYGVNESALRLLRTAAVGTDPWVSGGCNGSCTVAASQFSGVATSPSTSSYCASIGPSSTATPVGLPATSRCALSPLAGGTGAAATGMATPPTFGSDSEPRVPGSPAQEWHLDVNGACGAHAVADAGPSTAPGALPLQPGTGAGTCMGSGAEGVLVVCCSVDLEWWECDSSLVTEVGWTMWDNLTRQLVSRHHIVEEHEAFVNRIHVPNHKHDFLFGRSTIGSLMKGAAALQADLDNYGERVWAKCWVQQDPPPHQQQSQQQPGHEEDTQQLEPGEQELGLETLLLGPLASWATVVKAGLPPRGTDPRGTTPNIAASLPRPMERPLPDLPQIQLVIVGHGLSQDLKALSSLLGVTIPPTAAIVDTADLASAALESEQRTVVSLRVLLKMLDIAASKLHNGGNDARYTMEAMLALTALEPTSLAKC